MLPLATALLLAIVQGSPSPTADRARAEELARAGRSAEALLLFEAVVAADPNDVEARLWLARLALRLGRTADAEAGFRAVLREHPADVDARIGLGIVLTRTGAWREALQILDQTEPDAGENADLLGALARAHRRAGDDRRAVEYFRRARALAPDDPDLATGFEATVRAYGHWVGFEGFGQGGAPGTSAWSGTLAGGLRVAPRLHLEVIGRLQDGSDVSDAVAGAGLRWRAGRSTTASFGVRGGPKNVSLPRADVSGEAIHYAGAFEIGGNARWLEFASTKVLAVSPTLAWDDGHRWRLDGRYTYSRSSFEESGQTSGDNSVFLRATLQGWRRVALNAVYAYGIESFDDLTADRIGSLGTTTLAAGLRVDLPGLTRASATWERQWRTNDATVDRVTLSVVKFLP